MKKPILLIAFLLLSTQLVFAHCGTCGIEGKGSAKGDMMKKKMSMMTEKLDLTDEQAEQVEALLKTKMEKKKALHEEYHAGLEAILTDEQKDKHAEMKNEMKGSKHDHKGSMKKERKGSAE